MPISNDPYADLIASLLAPPVAPNQNQGFLSDLGTDVKRGIQSLPGTLTGLADIPVGLVTGRPLVSEATDVLGEIINFQPSQRAQEARAEYSEPTQAAQREFERAEGFLESLGVLAENPRLIASMTAESLPSMVLGGVAGRGLMAAGKLGAPAAIGAGEGLVSAGQQMADLTEAGAGTRGAAVASTLTGGAVGALGAVGGSIAQKMGLVNPEGALVGLGRPTPDLGAGLTLAQRIATEAPVRARLAQAAGGALVEGAFEELPQSMTEQMLQNVALGRPIGEGVGQAAAAGLATGSALGGGMNLLAGPQAPAADTPPTEPVEPPPAVPIPPEGEAAEKPTRDVPKWLERALTVEARYKDPANPYDFTGAFEDLGITDDFYNKLFAALQQGTDTVAGVKDPLIAKARPLYKAGVIKSPEELKGWVQAKREEHTAKLHEGAGPTEPVVSEAKRTKREEHIAKLREGAGLTEMERHTPTAVLPTEGKSATVPEGEAAEKPTRDVPKWLERALTVEARYDDDTQVTPSDLFNEVAIPHPKLGPQKSNLDRDGITALVGLINGNTEAAINKLGRLATRRVTRTVGETKLALRTNLLGEKSKLRAKFGDNLPKDLEKLTKSLLAFPSKETLDGRTAAGVARRAQSLARKYGIDDIRRDVNHVLAAYKQQARAGAPSDVTKQIRTVIGKLGLGGSEKADVLDLFDRIHGLTKLFDSVGDVVATTDAGKVTRGGKAGTHRQTPSIDFDISTAAQAAEVMTKPAASRTAADNRLLESFATQAAVEMEAAELATEGAASDVAPGLYTITDWINEAFQALDESFGRNNVIHAQEESVRQASVGKVPRAKPGQETSEAIRFNQLYQQYRENGSVQLTTGANPMRFSEERELRTPYQATDKLVTYSAHGAEPVRKAGQRTSKIEEVIEKYQGRTGVNPTAPAGVDSDVPPLQALLIYLGQTSISPSASLLANYLRSILQQSQKRISLARPGEHHPQDDQIANIDVVIHPEWSEGGTTGRYTAPSNPGDRATLELWQQGTAPRTILHETIHAVTLPIINYPRTDNQRALIADLDTLRKDLIEDLEGASGSSPRVRRILQYLAASPDSGLIEFIAYGLTDTEFQAWMKQRATPKGYKAKGKTWWAVFAHRLKLLLGMQAVPDSTFAAFVDASAGIMAEAYAGSEVGNNVFVNQPIGTTPTRRKPGVAFERVDPGKTWHGRVSSAAVTAATDARNKQENASNRANTEANKVRTSVEQDAKRAARRGERDAFVQARSTTAVPIPEKEHRANLLDRHGQMVADGLVSFLSGNRYPTWEAFVTKYWNAAGAKIRKFSEQDSAINRTVGYLLSRTVDQYGTQAAYRDFQHNMESMQQHVADAAYTDAMALQSLSVDMQYAMLRYSESKDEGDLTAALMDADKISTVRKLVSQWEAMRDKAITLGYLDAKYKGAPMSRFVDLKAAIDQPGYRRSQRSIYRALQTPNYKDQVVYADYPIPPSNVLTRGGVEVDPDDMHAKQFYRAANARGEEFFVEVGADRSLYDSLGIAPKLGETHSYFIKEANREGEYTLARRKTPAELQQERIRASGNEDLFDTDEKRATAVSAVTTLMQEWGRTVQGSEILEGMLDYNLDLPEGDRWILDGPPADVQPKHIIDFTLSDAARSDHSNQSKLRIPGFWVKLDTSSQTKAIAGPMAGKYVSGPVYMSMVDFASNEPIIRSKAWRTSLLVWKKNKTVFSTTANVNNVVGNSVMAYYYDIPAANLKIATRVILHEMFPNVKWKEPLTAQEQELLAEMKQEGLTLSQAKTADFDTEAEQILNNWLAETSASVRSLVQASTVLETLSNRLASITKPGTALGKAGAAVKGVPELAGDLYSNQDNIFRLAAYMTRIQEAHAKGEYAGTLTKQEASRYARQAFVDYRIHAPWIKGMRETLTPFIAWPYRMVPMLVKTMVLKPWKAANTAMAIYTLNALAYAALGADGDDEEYERSLQADWYKKGISWLPGTPANIRLPFSSGEGNAYFLNLSRLIPLGDVTATTDGGVPGVVAPGGPAAILMNLLSNYDPFVGKEITSGTDSAAEAFEKRMVYLGKATLPGTLVSISTAYGKADETGPLGYDYNFWVNAGKVLGINSFQMNLPEAALYKDQYRQRVERDFRSAISRRHRQELRQKDPDFEDAYYDTVALQERLMEALQELEGG